MFLEKIIKQKKKEIEKTMVTKPMPLLEALLPQAAPVRPFLQALTKAPGFPLIAEIKKASPSKGVLKADLDVAQTAKIYEHGGAAALSVLTDKEFFKGSLADLTRAKQATKLPVLRKDFILDPYQVYEARGAGADAVLLIVAALKPRLLKELYELVRSLGMDALIE